MTRMRWMKSSTILVNIYWWCEPHTQNPVMVSTTLGNKWPPNLQGEGERLEGGAPPSGSQCQCLCLILNPR